MSPGDPVKVVTAVAVVAIIYICLAAALFSRARLIAAVKAGVLTAGMPAPTHPGLGERFFQWLRGAFTMAEASQQTGGSRDTIALRVIHLAGFGIFLGAFAVIVVAVMSKPEDARSLVTTLFNTLIPLLGTWVGTVIAFYFARENFESAAKQTKDLVQQLGDEKLKQIKVQDAWTPVDKIKGVEVVDGEDAKTEFDKISDFVKTEKVTRVPIWTPGKVVRFIVHRSVVYQFQAQRDRAVATKPTVEEFLAADFDETKKMKDIVGKIAWLPRSATLADAKAKMEGTPDCQDVFITENGKKDEAILGWITNIDIANKSRA